MTAQPYWYKKVDEFSKRNTSTLVLGKMHHWRGNDGYDGVDGVNMDKTLAEADEIKIWAGIILSLIGGGIAIVNMIAYCTVLKKAQNIVEILNTQGKISLQ